VLKNLRDRWREYQTLDTLSLILIVLVRVIGNDHLKQTIF
jgi:hypothetical protein